MTESWPGDASDRPLVCVFGSFASELAVPGVSDLDLVVVDDSQRARTNSVANSISSRSATFDMHIPRPSSRSSSMDCVVAGQPAVLSRSQSIELRTSPHRVQRAHSTGTEGSPIRGGGTVFDRANAVFKCKSLGEALGFVVLPLSSVLECAC